MLRLTEKEYGAHIDGNSANDAKHKYNAGPVKYNISAIALKIDAMSFSSDKQAALSRLPLDVRDKVEIELQRLYHRRQQEFEKNKGIGEEAKNAAARISKIKSLQGRRSELAKLKPEVRTLAESCLVEIFNQRKQRGVNVKTA
jgi:hypothetical protein